MPVIRVGNQFNELKNNMKSEIFKIHNRKITDKMFTDELAGFITRERLDVYMINKAKRKRGLF